MAPLRYAVRTLAQSKERKGSNFAILQPLAGRTGIIAATSAVGNVFLVALFLMVTFGVIENSVTAVAAIFGSVMVLGMFLTGTAYALILMRQNPAI